MTKLYSGYISGTLQTITQNKSTTTNVPSINIKKKYIWISNTWLSKFTDVSFLLLNFFFFLCFCFVLFRFLFFSLSLSFPPFFHVPISVFTILYKTWYDWIKFLVSNYLPLNLKYLPCQDQGPEEESCTRKVMDCDLQHFSSDIQHPESCRERSLRLMMRGKEKRSSK